MWKGLVRLWIVLALPWALFWGWTYYEANGVIQRKAELIRRLDPDANYGAEAEFLAIVGDENVGAAASRRRLAARLGIIGPLGLGFVFAGGLWTWRGFRRDS